MPLINVLIVLIVVGVLLWLVNRFIPMQGTIKSILNAVVVICVVVWLLNVFGLFAPFTHIRVGGLKPVLTRVFRAQGTRWFGGAGRECYPRSTNGGDTVSTEAVAARRHAGYHSPAIGWNKTTGNSQLALAA